MVDSRKPRPRRRLIALLLISGLALAGAWFWKTVWLSPDIGSGPAGPAVPAEVFAKPWRHEPAVLLGLGDSMTAGYGGSPGHGYFDLLVTAPADEWPDMQGRTLTAVFPRLRSQNLAVSGTTSFEVFDGLAGKLQPFPADTLGIVVMTTGGNDLIHNYGRTPPMEKAMFGATWDQAQPWLAAYAQRLAALDARLATLFPGGYHLFIGTIFDPTDGVGDIGSAGLPPWPDGLRLLTAYNDAIRAFATARPHVHVVDIHGAFLGHGIHCAKFWRPTYHAADHGYWLYGNLEDPNDRGYDAIRRLMLNRMAEVFAEKPSGP